MAQIGSLVSSATQTFNLEYLPEFMLIEGPENNIPVSNLSVVSRGQQLVSVTAAVRLQAMSKFRKGGMLGSTVSPPQGIQLADGKITGATTINATNGAATTPAVYARSTKMSGIARSAVESSINASANQTYRDFEALFFLPANILRANVTFKNGFTDEFTPEELADYYAANFVTDTDGLLAGHICVPGDDVAEITLFNSSGGNTIVLATKWVQIK